MKIALVYWSLSGNTEAMAEALAEGLKSVTDEVDTYTASSFTFDLAQQYDRFAFGCPAMGSETLEEAEFEPMFEQILPNLMHKKVLLFGSYGWGDGEWMRQWIERCETFGAIPYQTDGLIIQYEPDFYALTTLVQIGRDFASLA